MNISLGVPVMNQQKETIDFLKKIQNTSTLLTKIYIVDNGSSPNLISQLNNGNFDSSFIGKLCVIRNEKNVGVRPALNQIWKACKEDILVITHNDVEFNEINWDKKIIDAFKKHINAGIIGCYGAKGIGTYDIYKSPYSMNQLARITNVSDCKMDKNFHNFRSLEHSFENVAVFDGFFMAIKKELLDNVKGFSDILPEHHNMDNLICIQSIANGYDNIVIPMDIFHRGGMTDVGQDWATGFGKTKQQVHEEAHPPLYQYCRGILPIWIKNIFDENGNVCGYDLHMDRKLIKTIIYE